MYVLSAVLKDLERPKSATCPRIVCYPKGCKTLKALKKTKHQSASCLGESVALTQEDVLLKHSASRRAVWDGFGSSKKKKACLGPTERFHIEPKFYATQQASSITDTVTMSHPSTFKPLQIQTRSTSSCTHRRDSNIIFFVETSHGLQVAMNNSHLVSMCQGLSTQKMPCGINLSAMGYAESGSELLAQAM